MIETIILDHLLSCDLSVGANVYMSTPVNPPDKYILIEKVGGSRADRIDSAMIAIQSRAKAGIPEAAELNEEVKAAMDDILTRSDIFSCKLNSDYNFTNPDTKEPRYQAVYDIKY